MSRGLDDPEVTVASAIAAGIPAQGALRERSALHLHYLAAAMQASGRLAVESGEAVWALTYRRGVVEHVSGSREEDDLAAFLVKRGLLPEEAAGDARQLAPAFGGDVLGALVELKLIDPAARFQDLKEHGASLVHRALASEEGAWRWEPGVPPPAYGFPLGSRWGLLVDAVRRIEPSGVRSRLGVRGALAASRVGGRVEVADLLLNPQEARAVSRIDGVRSADELCAAWPGDADAIRRVVLLLAETELVSFGAPRLQGQGAGAAPVRPQASTPPAPPPAPPAAQAAVAPPPAPPPAATAAASPAQTAATTAPPPPAAAQPAAAPPSAAVPPAATPLPATSAAPPPARPAPAPPRPPPAAAPPRPAAAKPAPPAGPTLASLQEVVARLEGGDHFQVLGVPRDADGARIKAAYFQLARTYHPDAAREGEPAEARPLRASIFARVAAAWAALETEAGRQAYLAELKAGGSAQVDIGRIYQAEQAFEKVAALAAGRNYADALARVNEAIGLYADEPEYHVWKAWLEFLLAPEAQRRTQRTAAERAIESALQRSPKCVPGWLFLGRMAKLTGDATAAERAWKRGLEQVQDAELERELRFLRR